jgi:caa(3)-type oxidase subunit IV
MAAQLTNLLKSRVSAIWLILIAATLISWKIGTDHGVHAHLATTIVLLVAFVKVRLVGLYFMELRNAPVALRLAFEGYCLVVCATLIAMYLAAGGA